MSAILLWFLAAVGAYILAHSLIAGYKKIIRAIEAKRGTPGRFIRFLIATALIGTFVVVVITFQIITDIKIIGY